ncbi:MAG: hypothetical protein AAF577_12950 [Pseudomonadota bacterium]
MRSQCHLGWVFGPIMAAMLLLVSPPDDAAAQTGPLGEIVEFLPPSGTEGAWQVENSGTAFSLTNRADDGAITYYWVDLAADAAGRRVIEAEVSLNPGGQSSFGGILYGFDPNTRNYFVYGLNAAGGVSLYRRDENGFREIMGTEIDAVRPGANLLRLEEQGEAIQMFVNGTRVSGIGAPGIGSGALGFAAGGTGQTSWTAFSVKTDAASRFTPLPEGDRSDAGQPRRVRDDTMTPVNPQTAGVSPSASDQTASGTQVAAASGPGQFVQFSPLEIVDRTGPLGSMVAYRVMVPNGWKTEGGVQWGAQGACFNGPRLIWGTGTQDDRYGMAIMPPISWSVNNFGGREIGCLQMDIQGAGQALEAYFETIGQQMGRFEILEISRPPEVQQTVQQTASMLVNGVPGQRSFADGILARVRSEIEGIESESYVVMITIHQELMQSGISGPMISRFGNVALMLVVSTPPGELDTGHPAFTTVMQTLQVDPQWDAAQREWWRRQNRPARQPSGGGGGSGLSSTLSSGGISDESHKKAVQGIWETQEFKSDDGSIYEGSTQYENAWKLDNGDVVFTNDQLFNPLQSTGQFGTQMESLR